MSTNAQVFDQEAIRYAIRAAHKRTPVQRVWAVVSWVLTAGCVAVVAALVVVPRMLGGAPLTILTGSMVPTYHPGDVVVVRGITVDEVCAEVQPGDVVTFMPTPDDPTLVTHRVVAVESGTFKDGTTCRLTTQGDANPSPDEPIGPVQVRGIAAYSVPKIGWAKQWVTDLAGGNPQSVTFAAAGLLLVYAVVSLLRPRRKVRVAAVPDPDPAGGRDACDPIDSAPSESGASR